MGVTPDKRKTEHAPDAYSPHSKKAKLLGDWPQIQVSSLLARPLLLRATRVAGMLIVLPGKPWPWLSVTDAVTSLPET